MTVDLLFATLYVGSFVAFLVAAVALVRRNERRLDGGGSGASQPGRGDPISDYLDRLTAALNLPAADVAEVRSELTDHLQDSIASLEAEGLDRERAAREALARLGSADELGRHLRHAHQSTKRLLAGAGGGVFAAGGGFVLGYLGGLVLALLLGLVIAAITAVLTRIGLPIPDLTDSRGDTFNSLLLGVCNAVGAGVAVRYAVRTSAGMSRRTPRSLALFWGVAGAIGFGWYAIFGMHGQQSWPGVVVELSVPLVALAAATIWIERPMPHVGRWAVAIVLVSVVGSALMGIAVSSGSVVSSTSAPATISEMPDTHFDIVAPLAPTAWLPAGYPYEGSGQMALGQTQVSVVFGGDQQTATALARWSDVRFEAWRALPYDNPDLYGVDPHYSSPFAIQPATSHDRYLDVTFDFGRIRDVRSWWLFLTGLGPDGHRYRLADLGGYDSSFNGSVWDWLTAPL
jgi:hypothetical protein